jgi:nuclear pore complex protein Nup188
LFEALVRSAVAYDTEPPSLLGHLGPKTAKDFLDVLADLDKPLDNEALNVCIWNLLSAVISNRQPWFATYLLTGTTPRNSIKTDGKASGQDLRELTRF